MKIILRYLVLTILVGGFCNHQLFSQGVAINTSGAAAHASAMLDVSSTSSGMLAPRMSAAQRSAISNPATGLLVFQTDGSSGFYYYTGSSWIRISSGINASGTANYVSKFTDATTLGSSQIFDNGTNVGIGTASPSQKLEINGMVQSGGYRTTSGSTNYHHFTRNGGGTAVYINQEDASNAILRLSSGIYTPNQNVVLTVENNGYLGLGTLSPSVQLHTTGGVRFQNLGGSGTRFVTTDNNGVLSAATAAGAGLVSGTGTASYVARWTSSTNIGTGTIQDNGTRIGIGTAPHASYLAQVGGDVLLTSGWLRTTGSTGWYSETHGGGWYMTDATWIRTYNNKSVYQNSGTLRTDGTFQVGPAGATLNVPYNGDLSYRTNVLFANTSGNVGIGTASPGQKLHVNGNIKLDDNMMVEGMSNYRVYRNLASYNNSSGSAAGAFVITTNQPWNSACMFRVKIEGYFYDATSPFELIAGGYIYTTNSFYNYGYVNIGAKQLNVRFARNISTNTVAIIIGSEGDSYSYPKLTVTSFMQGHSNINETYADGWTIAQYTSLANFDYITTVPNVTTLPTNSNYYIQNQTASNQSANFRISGSGYIASNVGIGTTSPQAKLHVTTANASGSGTPAGGLMWVGGKNDNPDNQFINFRNPSISDGTIPGMSWWSPDIIFGRYKNETFWSFKETHAGGLGSATKDIIRAYVDDAGGYQNLNKIVMAPDAGNVGIGTSTPSSKLHVNAGSVRISGSTNTNVDTGGMLIYSNTSGLGAGTAKKVERYSKLVMSSGSSYQIYDDFAVTLYAYRSGNYYYIRLAPKSGYTGWWDYSEESGGGDVNCVTVGTQYTMSSDWGVSYTGGLEVIINREDNSSAPTYRIRPHLHSSTSNGYSSIIVEVYYP